MYDGRCAFLAAAADCCAALETEWERDVRAVVAVEEVVERLVDGLRERAGVL